MLTPQEKRRLVQLQSELFRAMMTGDEVDLADVREARMLTAKITRTAHMACAETGHFTGEADEANAEGSRVSVG